MKRKLQSNRGASILMALLLLLLAIVVSAVILLAATNAARHVDNEFDAQQNYLAVSSAAELVRDSILSEKYIHEDTLDVYPDGSTTTSSTNIATPSGIMADWLIKGINDPPPSPDGHYTDTITINVSQGTENVLPDVQAAFSMDNSLNIKIVFSLDQDNARTSTVTDNCYMTLTLTGNDVSVGSEVKTDQKQTYITTRTVQWSGAKIRKGAVT